MATQAYSSGQASRLTGVPYRTLDYWARTRFIVPSAAEASGTGSERRYTFKDLVALRIVRELRAGGVSTRALRRVIEFLRSAMDVVNPLSELRLVVAGNDVLLVTGNKELISVLRNPTQSVFAFVLDVTRTVAELKERAEQLSAA